MLGAPGVLTLVGVTRSYEASALSVEFVAQPARANAMNGSENVLKFMVILQKTVAVGPSNYRQSMSQNAGSF